MTDYTIIDRRVSPKGKNLSNRQRFLERTKQWVKKKVRERSSERGLTSEEGESITISSDDISEPTFDYDRKKGVWDRVLPGNKDYLQGDKIKRDQSGQGQGRGNKASDSGEGEDDFVFTISKEEYLDILFEDLELPDLIKHSENAAVTFARQRAGFSTSGSPNNLDLEKSLKNALGRKIALGFPLDKKIKEKEQELLLADDKDKAVIQVEIDLLRKRRLAITYIDQVDVRYKRHTQVPIPNSQAVVCCLMDVSGSMGKDEKDTAKRFFLLLYLFLQRKYKKVDIVFVRHTTEADECTEHEFFYGTVSGGTVVSAGVKAVNNIVKERYPLDAWNVYVVQASDGDNFDSDNDLLSEELDALLPKCQYYVYNEVMQTHSYRFGDDNTNVIEVMNVLKKDHPNLSVIRTGSVDEVVSNFREVFTKKDKNVK